MNKTPSELNINKGTVIPPVNGWKENTYYIVKVAFSNSNCIHKVIFYSGFLDNGKPCGYNCLLNPMYDGKYKITDTYYLEVVEELSLDLRR